MKIRAIALLCALGLFTPAVAAAATVDDFDKAHHLGNNMKAKGFFTEFNVSGWGPTFEATISSLLPGQAREVALLLCETFRTNMDRSWEVRVFLANSAGRPAASCQSK
jgi:hypothetical protein